MRSGSEGCWGGRRPPRKTNPGGRQVARIGCFVERNRGASIESLERSYDVDRIEKPKPPQALSFSPPSDSLENGFYPDEIETRVGRDSDQKRRRAYSFMMYMRLCYRNKPHWQVARQAVNHASASDAGEIQAWRTFRAAAEAEGWLAE